LRRQQRLPSAAPADGLNFRPLHLPPAVKKNLPIALFAAGIILLGGCVTHITTDVLQNPPPAEKFAAFTHFEIRKIALNPPYDAQSASQRALVKIQENVSLRADPMLANWNAGGAAVTPARGLLIEPTVTEIKFVSGNKRVWTGALSGSSAVVLVAKITDRETGKVIASPTFYAHAAAMGGAWSLGTTDNLMLARVAGRFTSYLEANYAAAVGGPSGADPATK